LLGILIIKTIIASVTLLISALTIAGYPLTEERHEQIIEELKARRGAEA
jgi:Na+/melibiose symporter-like transporter